MRDRDDPFAEIERLVERFGGLEGLGLTTASVPVDVVDTGEAVVVTADLPGYAPDDIEVTVDDGTLVLRATRETATEAGDRYVRQERERRASRRLSLPAPVVEDEASASYDGGVLTVRLPRRDADDDGHQIEIE